MQPRIKVLQIIDSLKIGGAERQLLELVRFIDKNVFDLSVCSLTIEDNNLWQDFEKSNIAVFAIKQFGFFDYSCLKTLIGYIKRLKPDIVNTFLFTADCYGRIAARLADVGVIISSSRNVDLWKKSRHILTDRILAKITAQFVANADAVKEFLMKKEGIPSEKISVIYNGLDLKRFDTQVDKEELRRRLAISAEKKIITMIARFAAQKDYLTFLSAARIVRDKIKDVHFIVVGDDKPKDTFTKIIQDSGLQEEISILYNRTDVPEILSLSDICLLTSLYEGCSNFILESMAAGLPVVATAVGGNPELIRDGQTGFLVVPRAPEEVAKKVIFLLSNPEIARHFGEEARRRVEENFSAERMAREYQNLYLELYSKSV